MSAGVSEYLEKIENIQAKILTFIENEDNKEENYQNLLQLFDDHKILDNPSETKLILTLISKISDNHYRVPTFFGKIEQILLFFKDSMTKNLSNYDIYTIFSNNKRIILFFLKEGIIKIDIKILNNLIGNKKALYDTTSPNLKYFLPEIKLFIDTQKDTNNKEEEEEKKNFKEKKIFKYKEEEKEKKNFKEKGDEEEEEEEEEETNFIEEEEKAEKNNFVNIKQLHDHINQLYQTIVNDDFEKKRNLGENDDNICQLIQKDLIEEFIIEYNKTNFSLKMEIPSSFYETNPFLLHKTPTLIQYASFYGSTQIFRFLYKNKVKLTSSLWPYAIHSDNSELISILEENCPKPESLKEAWIEAVKCHHNSMANYFQNNYSIEICYKFFSFFNISILTNNAINREIMFYYSCKYDYYDLCKILLSSNKVNVNYYKSTWIDEFDTIYIQYRTVNYEIKRRLISEKTPFAAACQNCNIDIINLLLLDDKIDINLPNSYIGKKKKITTKTPLYMSLENNKFDIVKILLSRPEIDVNFHKISENVSKPVLCLAVRLENNEIVKLLLSNPEIDVNIGEKSKELYQTALCLAVRLENIEIVKLLLSNPEIDVNIGEKSKELYQTALCLAVKLENIEIVKLLLSNQYIDANIKENSKGFNHTALYLAVELQNIEIVKLLLSNQYIDVNIECDVLYQYTVKYGNTNKLESYISQRTPLSLAVELGRYDIVELIIEKDGVDINKKNLFSLLKSNLFGAEEKNALYIAVENKKLEVVKTLLKNKDIDVNALNCICRKNGYFDYETSRGDRYIDFVFYKYKKTALHFAVENHLVKYVELLLSDPRTDVNILSETFKEYWGSGAKDYDDDIDDVDFYNIYTDDVESSSSALDIALDNNDTEMFKLLLSNPKIDVNLLTKSDNTSQTVLHRAVYKRKVEMVKLLLSHPKIDVNIGDKKETALHIAYQKKNQEIIDLLLKRNDINVNALDSYGKKPSYYKYEKSYYRW